MKTLPLVTASAGILLSLMLTGCSAPSAEEPTAKPTKSASSESGSPLDSMSEKQIDAAIGQIVTSQGQQLCDQLGPIPDESLPAALDTVKSALSSQGISAKQAEDVGEKVLTGSAEQFCPDQSARIETALG